MLRWFNRLKLATRIVTVTLVVVIAVVAVNYLIFVRGYRASAQEALVEKAKALSAVADAAKNHTSLLHQTGTFDTKTLTAELKADLAAGKAVKQTRFFQTIPVVAGWTAAQEAAQREKIEFRITAFKSRNREHEPAAGSFDERLLRQLTEQVAAGQGDVAQGVNPADNTLHVLRAIRLTENCLACHGAPGSQWDVNQDGKDPTGFQMEGWKTGDMHGSYHVVMPLAPVNRQVAAFLLSAMAWTLPLLLVAITALVYLIAVLIRRPVNALKERTTAIAQGDLTQEIPGALLARQDEIGDLARALRDLSTALRTSLLEVLNSTGTLGVMSAGLFATSQRLTAGAKGTSARADTVAAAAEESSANTVSVAAGMEQASTNLSSVAAATEELSATMAEIAGNSARARAVGEQASAQAQAVATVVQELGQAAQAIGKVTETITHISAQTNLLALNATIEAARAGAAGKGFAVVAHEIKELARQTAAATEDIKAKISGVQTSTASAIVDIEKISGVIREVGQLVASIATAIEEQTAVTKDVAVNVAQASTGIQDANERVAQTASVSKDIAKDIAEVSAQGRAMNNDSLHLQEDADMLRGVTDRLKELAGRFELGQSTDFAAIKQGHLQWRSRLIAMFEGRQALTAADVTDHHACALGKWYDQEGHARFQHLEKFPQLGAEHQAFHTLVGQIVQLWNGGRQPEARQRFEKLLPHTTRLFALLDGISLDAARAPAGGGGGPVPAHTAQRATPATPPKTAGAPIATGKPEDANARIPWKEDYSVGVLTMDAHHQKLISLINRLHAALKQGAGTAVAQGILKELMAYTQYHFQAEEELMAKVNFNGLAAQQQVHGDFLRVVTAARDRWQGGDASVPQELLMTLENWLVQHITGMDKQYGPCVIRHLAGAKDTACPLRKSAPAGAAACARPTPGKSAKPAGAPALPR